MNATQRPAATDLRALLTSNDIVVCTGSGGVGKTTTAAVLALEAARFGHAGVRRHDRSRPSGWPTPWDSKG